MKTRAYHTYARDMYYNWRHFDRKASYYAALYEMGDDSAFTRQTYAMIDASIYANRLHSETGRWPDEMVRQ